jgi:hypothetical protein
MVPSPNQTSIDYDYVSMSHRLEILLVLQKEDSQATVRLSWTLRTILMGTDSDPLTTEYCSRMDRGARRLPMVVFGRSSARFHASILVTVAPVESLSATADHMPASQICPKGIRRSSADDRVTTFTSIC